MNLITYKELHKQLMYNPWTGYFYWCISRQSIKIGKIAGTKSNGYIVIKINKKPYKAHRLAWLYVYGYFPENDIDHRDQTRHHNWWSNLRETSNQCNQRNRGNPVNNTSNVKGVYWHKQNKLWQVIIVINNKNKFLGYYKSFDNAVCARLAGEQCVGWDGCDLNSPAYLYVKEVIREGQ